MADDSLFHTAELLKTALPYVDVKSRLTLDLLVKLYELIICMRNYRTNDITACGFENESEKADMETLLNKIRPKCNEQEGSFVDKMLNIFQAKKMFEMYNTYMEAMNAMNGFEGFGGGDSDGNASDDDSGGFMSSFKNFDFSSIFGKDFDMESFSDNFKDAVSDNVDKDNGYNSGYEIAPYSDEIASEKASNYSLTPNNDIINITDDEDIIENNNKMFESLKGMIPPEQMQTFENLRMLFGSTSYDDNNKSDENKE